MARYVNIFKEKDGTRRISDNDWSNRGDAETFPIMDRELVTETAHILNEQEEKEFIREIEEPLENLSKARLNKLLNLLAVIHRDGGHYVTQHGLNKACEDAKKVILNERSFNKKEFAKE